MNYRYIFNGETITTQDHKEPPEPGYPITFVGRHGKLAPAEHFVVTAVINDSLILECVNASVPIDYPAGIVNGPCFCGSWPGGECLKCPRM